MPRGKPTPLDVRAEVLAYSRMQSDESAAEEYGVSARSVQRWRKEMAENQELASLVAKKRAEIAERWGDRIGPVIEKAMDFVRRGLSGDGMDPRDPQAVKAANGTAKIFAEIALARDILIDDKHEDAGSQKNAGANGGGSVAGRIGGGT